MSPEESIRSHDVLWNAWFQVRQRALLSSDPSARAEAERFDRQAPKAIRSISSKLSAKSFQFELDHGYRKKKKQGWRPVVVGTIRNRVVRRAILDVLQQQPELIPYFENPTSFGGIRGKGVSEAVTSVDAEIAKGATHFITSDIKNFFTAIPREKALAKIREAVGNDYFMSLVTAATDTELNNFAELGDDADKFPLKDLGVAQGNCLSPLIGNILLHEFDSSMNRSSDVRCFRYIDDFIITGPSAKAVNAKFQLALTHLHSLNLSAYDPWKETGKAFSGETTDTFKYLGIEFKKKKTRPSRESREKLINQLHTIFSESLDSLRRLEVKRRRSFADATKSAQLTCLSWKNQYVYCTDKKILIDTSHTVHKIFEEFRLEYIEQLSAQGDMFQRNSMLGFRAFEPSSFKE